MGLDVVDLFLDLEEQFEIEISDFDGQQLKTVGDLYFLVVSKLRESMSKDRRDPASSLSLTDAAHSQIRNALSFVLDIPIDEIDASTKLDSILPKSGRRRIWQELRQCLGLELPELVRPTWLVNLLPFAVLSGSVYFLTQLPEDLSWPLHLLLLLGSIAALAFIACICSIPMATNVPKTMPTVQDLAEQVVALNFFRLRSEFHGWEDQDVWKVLKLIIVEQLDVKPELVTPDARFIEDLKAY